MKKFTSLAKYITVFSFSYFVFTNNFLAQQFQMVVDKTKTTFAEASEVSPKKWEKINHSETAWFLEIQKEKPNIFRAEKAFQDYFQKNPNERSKQRKIFLRWLDVSRLNVDADGFLIKNDIANYKDLIGVDGSFEAFEILPTAGSWRMIGPHYNTKFQCDGESSNMSGGYVDRVYINPYNTQNMFGGFSYGGLWVSHDEGESWTLTDSEFPNGTNSYANNDRYYGEIETSEATPTTIYAATEAGLLKSTDAGDNWNYCSQLNRIENIDERPYFIAVSPTNADIITSTFGKKVFHSTDGGTTWTEAFDNTSGGAEHYFTSQHVITEFGFYSRGYNFFGLEIDYDNPNMLYLGVWNSDDEPCIYKSVDGGASFSFLINLNTVNGRTMPNNLKIQTIDASPNKFFVYPEWETNDVIYTYDENGVLINSNALQTISEAGDISWTDENTIYNGKYLTSNVYKSTDGGENFTEMVSANTGFCKAVHADTRAIDVIGDLVLIGTDGGMSLSKDGMLSAKSIGHEISAVDLWGFGSSLRSDICVASMDHGPSSIRKYVGDAGWHDRGGADALHGTVSQSNDRWVYYNRNYGGRFKEYVNADSTLSQQKAVSPPFGLHLLEFHPYIYTIIYGYDNATLYRTIDHFDTDEGIETIFTFSKNIKGFKIARDEPETMYVLLSNDEIRKSNDSGATWTDITPSLGSNLLFIALGNTPNDIFVALGNHQNTTKILKSTDGGASWQNWTSANLPIVPPSGITHQIGTDGGIYMAFAGMNGVWYRNDTMAEWEELGTGLPMFGYVKNIFAVPNKGVYRMGSSRGAWEHDLREASSPIAAFSVETNQVTCSNQIVEFVQNSSHDTIAVSYNWIFEGASPASSTEASPKVSYPNSGVYDVSLTITDANGLSDTKTLEDFITVNNTCDDNLLSPHENQFVCSENNIAQTAAINEGQEILVHDFTLENATEFFVDLDIFTDCDNKIANLQALIDVAHSKIIVSKYFHFDATQISPILGDGTSNLTSFQNETAQIAFEIRDAQLYFSMIENACGNTATARINASCWSEMCFNNMAESDWLSGGEETEIMDFSTENSNLFYASLNAYVNCYGTSARALVFIDIANQSLQVIDYFHFNSEESSGINGSGTNTITATSFAFGNISYRLDGSKLYFVLNNQACGSTGKFTASCWKSLATECVPNECLDINVTKN